MAKVVGLFEDNSTAQLVVRELTARGFRQQDIQVSPSQSADPYATGTGSTTGSRTEHEGFGEKVSGFFNSIFGTGDAGEERGYYAETLRRGGVAVAIEADGAQADQAEETMSRLGAIDVADRAAFYQENGYEGFDANAAPYSADQIAQEREQFRAYQSRLNTGGEMSLPVVQEELAVGKRAVERGGVRVVSRMTERPVEETVHLREERVNVERRPVDRAVGEADLSAFQEGTIEVTAMSEEAVVSKQSRVVEEVVVNKEVTERDQTIRDTVRRTDVDVQEVSPEERRKGQTSGR